MLHEHHHRRRSGGAHLLWHLGPCWHCCMCGISWALVGKDGFPRHRKEIYQKDTKEKKYLNSAKPAFAAREKQVWWELVERILSWLIYAFGIHGIRCIQNKKGPLCCKVNTQLKKANPNNPSLYLNWVVCKIQWNIVAV